MWADALSTALTVLGPDAGLAWAEAREIAALWTTRRRDGGFDETMSRACAALAQ
jgi:thiamine biosynthesis lipoprotein